MIGDLIRAGVMCAAIAFAPAVLAKEQTGEVEITFESTVAIKPTPKPLVECANAVHAQDDLGAALDLCNEAVAAEPDNGDAYYYRGYAHYYLDRIEDAEADFSKAIDLDTKFLAESYYARGTCKERLRRLREASVDFKKAHEVKPDWSPAKRKVDEYQWAYE